MSPIMMWISDEHYRLLEQRACASFVARLVEFVRGMVAERFEGCSTTDVEGLVTAAVGEANAAGITEKRRVAQYVAIRFWATGARIQAMSVPANQNAADAWIGCWLDAAERFAAAS